MRKISLLFRGFFKLTIYVYEQRGGVESHDGLVPNYVFNFNVWLCTL